MELAREKYVGFNHTHLTEMLREEERIEVSRPSVRWILFAAGMRSPKTRRASKHRRRRERYAQEGMLLQVDGSRHDWLEGRGPELTLIAGIDDATGKVPLALFRGFGVKPKRLTEEFLFCILFAWLDRFA